VSLLTKADKCLKFIQTHPPKLEFVALAPGEVPGLVAFSDAMWERDGFMSVAGYLIGLVGSSSSVPTSPHLTHRPS